MTQYIDKSAVVAKIERLISNGQTKLKESEECNDYESYVALAERIATCINVLSFLDTLEIKEVDLEKEVINWWKDYYKDLKDSYTFENYNGHYMNNSTIIKLAQHFFELGLKVQKGE